MNVYGLLRNELKTFFSTGSFFLPRAFVAFDDKRFLSGAARGRGEGGGEPVTAVKI